MNVIHEAVGLKPASRGASGTNQADYSPQVIVRRRHLALNHKLKKIKKNHDSHPGWDRTINLSITVQALYQIELPGDYRVQTRNTRDKFFYSVLSLFFFLFFFGFLFPTQVCLLVSPAVVEAADTPCNACKTSRNI